MYNMTFLFLRENFSEKYKLKTSEIKCRISQVSTIKL